MNKTILFIFSLLVFGTNAYTQDLFFKAGRNSTSYDFKNSLGQQVIDLSRGTGSSYEIGLGFPISLNGKNHKSTNKEDHDRRIRFHNQVSFTVNQYTANGGNLNNNYLYVTNFGGFNDQLALLAHLGNLEIGISGIIGINKLMSGTQVINSKRYDLKEYQEFQGEFLQTGLGASVLYPIVKSVFLSASYQRTKNRRSKMQDSEHVNFNSNTIFFGIHFNLK
jgi:hypothetical protein